MSPDESTMLYQAAPEELASRFLAEFRARAVYGRDVLARLIELALSEDRRAAGSASRAFFNSLVERLADSFEPESVTLYNRVFAQLVQQCRATAPGRGLDRRLSEFNLESEDDLVARAEKLRHVKAASLAREARQPVRRVVVLSRVTLGADVAITSVMIERAKQEFPDAEILLVGGRKAAELFGGERRLAFKEVGYRRAGTATERLLSWLDVSARVAEATGGLKRGEYLIVDPDSRLTQLGMLPLTDNEGPPVDYLLFPSREYASGSRSPLGELAALWLDEVFGAARPVAPQVYLARADLETGREAVRRMRAGGQGPVVTINFGVGGNQAKRVGDRFETSLVSRLIKEGATVILDKGAGEEEAARAGHITEFVKGMAAGGRPARAIEADEPGLPNLLSSGAIEADLFVWGGRIGVLAALISCSDLYIGYDSAGQHIAAALGVPCVAVFAGYSSPRMLDRWRPAGRAEARIVAVDGSEGEDAVLAHAMGHAAEVLGRINP